MPDFDRLKTALADRYTIEREIGSGGFTTAKAAARLSVAESDAERQFTDSCRAASILVVTTGERGD